MESVVHFEMPYEDKNRLAAFYAEVFGWTMTPLGEEYGQYVMAVTTESDMKGPKKPGAINGGFFPKKPDWPTQVPSVVISVSDINNSIRKISASGGRPLGQPMEIPNVGLYVSFIDTEGNRVSLIQHLNAPE